MKDFRLFFDCVVDSLIHREADVDGSSLMSFQTQLELPSDSTDTTFNRFDFPPMILKIMDPFLKVPLRCQLFFQEAPFFLFNLCVLFHPFQKGILFELQGFKLGFHLPDLPPALIEAVQTLFRKREVTNLSDPIQCIHSFTESIPVFPDLQKGMFSFLQNLQLMFKKFQSFTDLLFFYMKGSIAVIATFRFFQFLFK